MLLVVEAAGHPRDMGLEQGRQLAAWIRAYLDDQRLPSRRRRRPSLGAFTTGAVRGAGPGRETIRHYTHLAERMDGLARGAGVPLDGIVTLHATAAADPPGERRPAVAIAAVGLDDSPGPTLARSLSGVVGRDAPIVVRRSRPAVGFESVEVTLPWLVTALGGVNEAGLSVCIVPEPAGEPAHRPAPSPRLLVQECLQRFESVGGGIDWSCRRPAHGWATLLLADANGDCASVRFEGDARAVARTDAAPLAAGRPERLVDALREAAAGPRTLDVKALCPPDDSAASSAWLRLTPTRRTVEVQRPAAPREELLVQV